PALDRVAAVVRGDGVEQRSARTPRRLLLVGSRRGRHQDARGERERCEARQETSRQGRPDQAKKVPPSTDRATSPRIAALYAAGFTRSSGEPGGCREGSLTRPRGRHTSRFRQRRQGGDAWTVGRSRSTPLRSRRTCTRWLRSSTTSGCPTG